MPKRRQSPDASRRNFLKGAGLVGAAAAAAVTPPVAANAMPAVPEEKLKAALPSPRQVAAETMPPANDPVNQSTSGGDFMTYVLNSLGIEYMAMYNAWCDRVPVLVMGGNIMEADKRAPGAEWLHSGVDIGQIVREFTKWDDQPASLQHFAESTARAYKIATTPPMGPVVIALDAELQENPISNAESLRIPKFEPAIPPQGDSAALAEAAKMLVEAQNPVILCDRVARTPAGVARLVDLAETLQCGVIDYAGRMNFPSRHPLNQSFSRALIGQADVIL